MLLVVFRRVIRAAGFAAAVNGRTSQAASPRQPAAYAMM